MGFVRRLFTVLSALSLLLCVAVAVLWVRSYFAVDQLYGGQLPPDEGRTTAVTSRGGHFRVTVFRGVSQGENRGTTNWRQNWFVFETGEQGPLTPTQPVQGIFIRQRWVAVPYWVPALLLATAAVPVTTRAFRSFR